LSFCGELPDEIASASTPMVLCWVVWLVVEVAFEILMELVKEVLLKILGVSVLMLRSYGAYMKD
jgi:hypothetical protein